jgi:hypothetical protein
MLELMTGNKPVRSTAIASYIAVRKLLSDSRYTLIKVQRCPLNIIF